MTEESMMDVTIGRSPLLRESLDPAVYSRGDVQAARQRLHTLRRSTPHHHVGACPSLQKFGQYQPMLCDCGGPEEYERQLDLLEAVFRTWFDAGKVDRLKLDPLVRVALTALGPRVVSCTICAGDGVVGPTRARFVCPRCLGRGIRQPGPRMNVPRGERSA